MRLHKPGDGALLTDFRLVLLSASVAVLAGIIFVPTAQRLFARAIGHFQQYRSTTRMLLRTATPMGLRTIRESLVMPSRNHLGALTRGRGVGWGVLIANCLAQALLTVGVFASLYAGYLNPEYRVTASQLSAVINGLATILLFAFIDPQLSVMTDDVIEGRVEEPLFRRAVMWISPSRLAGTVLAQLLFLPAAMAIAFVATLV